MGRALGLAAEVSVLGSEISRVSGPDDWAIVEVLEMRRKKQGSGQQRFHGDLIGN
jgi:hypothetical protein